MTRLEELAIKYSCDKYYAHSYIPFYERELESRIEIGWSKVRRLLEIGIGYEELMKPFVPRYVQASSLKMWQEYLPGAEIFACDIRKDALYHDHNSPTPIWSLRIDQSKPRELWDLIEWSGGSFDVIIDDGSHETQHQIITAAVMMAQLKEGGLYVIEDVREPERVADAIGGEIHRFNKRPDDCLVVVRR